MNPAVHVFNETSPLRQVMVWGEPGCEALLGQLLPKSQSLFFSYYEVPEARRELRKVQRMIEAEGIQVIRIKDAYVASLADKSFPDMPATMDELKRRLHQRADELYEAHRDAKAADLAQDGLSIGADEVYLQVKQDMDAILREDVESYGEAAAVKLNYVLSLSRPLPISNIVYGRDQSNALGGRIVLSIMRWEIRRPEVEIYAQALNHLGYGSMLAHVEQGTIEGGDSIIFGKTCYIGVGARTSMDAVVDVCRLIGDTLEEHDIDLVAVVNQKHAEESPARTVPTHEHMQVMHLDTFWIPLDEKTVMGDGREIDQRRAVRVRRENGSIKQEDLGNFREYLSAQGLELIEVDQQEQKDFATNLLNLGNQRLLVSLSKNGRVIAELEKRGFRVLKADILKLVGGYGAVHCLTAPVLRD
ncbi:MAG TPA: arginine deiminase family protein [Anaerolineales bacterium]|jgi:arginine deiminase